MLAAFCLASCAGSLASNPGIYSWHKEMVDVAADRLHVTVVKPASPNPPPFLIVFASGDGGLTGVSKAILQHFADRGYYVAGFSSREALKALRTTGGRLDYAKARDTIISVVREARRALGLSDRIPTIVTGMSRGANMVIASGADRTLQAGLAGAVAIALTREFDYLSLPEGTERLPGVTKDEEGRIQTYPAIERLGALRLAIIQSTNDNYVGAAESRRLLGPDTPTRRLYAVDAKDHSFGGGEDALMRNLDDAMKWISGEK